MATIPPADWRQDEVLEIAVSKHGGSGKAQIWTWALSTKAGKKLKTGLVTGTRAKAFATARQAEVEYRSQTNMAVKDGG